MRACYLAKELAPHLARPHELRAQAVHPKPERLIQRGNSEPDVVGATNLEARMLGHVDFLPEAGPPVCKEQHVLR